MIYDEMMSVMGMRLWATPSSLCWMEFGWMSDRRVCDEIYPACPFSAKESRGRHTIQFKHEETFSLPLSLRAVRPVTLP